ncbi:MAG TPA: DUF1292 domain-containing protein [Candidatus Fimousia stercorigallinarum]|nr:DUF1292 domain-containing protein [Candidatus Fimousia stercorigallinarum]
MSKKQDTIVFFDAEDNEIELRVLEQTTIAGQNYLLVLDEEEDAVLLFKEVPEEGDFVSYEIVEDNVEIEALLKVFNELLDDMDIQI